MCTGRNIEVERIRQGESIMTGVLFGLATGAVLLFAVRFKRWEIFRNYLVRCCFGIVFIYFVNTVLEEVNVLCEIGCNGVTISIAGLLGLPGLVILYGINGFIL